MNRAIGAIGKTAGVNSFGMMYQWGRKDPFTPATTTAGKDTQLYNATGTPINTKSSNGIGGEWTYASTASNITVLTSKPSTHFGSSVPIASTGNLSNDWWNPVAKTLYDPCPSGYRIPPSGTYYNFPMSSGPSLAGGANWYNSFFPVSGCRLYSSGKFGNVGAAGYYRMSTPYNNSTGYTLDSSYRGVDPSRRYPHSSGYSVRCISE